MPFRMGPWEIALIAIVVVMIFGVGKLPQVGKALGKGLRAIQRGKSGEDQDEEEEEPVEKTIKKSKKLKEKA